MNPQTAASAAQNSSQSAFAFVQALAAELTQGTIELPAFPEVVVRIRRALDDPDCSMTRVAQMVSAEPTLAARLLAMANSAAFTHVGKPIADLHAAITRLGGNVVRGAAISFAVAQLRHQPALKPIERSLKAIWAQSTHVAAICCVLAKHTRINPDEAFLAGLLHAMGKLYVVVRAASHRDVFGDAQALEEIAQEWHAAIAKAILESWNLPEPLIAAVAQQDDVEIKHYGEANLTDVLICAKVLAKNADDPISLVTCIGGIDAFRHLRLDAAECIELLISAAERISALRKALDS